jgi:hypothetical protein
MADENREKTTNAAASAVKGAAKTGKAIANIAKGAATGGMHGAALAAAGSFKKYIPIIVGILLLPIVIVAMLPSIIFGSIFGDGSDGNETPNAIVDDTVLTQNLVDISASISTVLSEGLTATIDEINADFASSGCDSMEVNNPYAAKLVYNANSIICQYCASLNEDVESISKEDLEHILRSNKNHLYSYSYRDETRVVESTSYNEETGEYESSSYEIVVRVYTVSYNGEAYFGNVVFGLDNDQKTLSRNYAQNLSTLLQDDVYQALCGAELSAMGFSSEGAIFSETEIDVGIFGSSSSKNATDLVKYAINAYESGWGYVWGTFGNILDEALLASKMYQYPAEVGGKESTIREKWMGHRVTDCVGLIKSYSWFNPETLTLDYASNGMPDYGANQMYYSATKSGTIDTLPEIPGLALWCDGHIGVYIGGGQAIEARGTDYGVVKTNVADRSWTHWLQIAFISY